MARFTNANPTVDDTPRDSLTAQTISWEATLVAVAVGRAVPARLVLALTVNGTKESSVDCLDDRDIVSLGWRKWDEVVTRREKREVSGILCI